MSFSCLQFVHFSRFYVMPQQKITERELPDGSVVKNLPSNAGERDSILAQGTKITYAAGQLSLHPQLERSLCHNEELVQPKKRQEGSSHVEKVWKGSKWQELYDSKWKHVKGRKRPAQLSMVNEKDRQSSEDKEVGRVHEGELVLYSK